MSKTYFVFRNDETVCKGEFNKIGVKYYVDSKGRSAEEAFNLLKRGICDKIEYDYRFIDDIDIKDVKHNFDDMDGIPVIDVE